MTEVYDITDDDVVLAKPPRSKSSKNGGETTERTTSTTTTKGGATQAGASKSPLSPRKNSHANSRNSPPLQDVHMGTPEQEVVPATSSSPRSTSPAPADGQDIKMQETTTPGPPEEMIMENGGSVAKKQKEITPLPNLDTSDPDPDAVPATLDQDQKKPASSGVSSSDAPSTSSANVNGHAKPSPSSRAPSVNGVSADEKSKKPASTSVKPKSKRRSPSPQPLPSRPRMQTIRLDIPLGGPERYEVDILQLSKETGQRPLTPPPTKRDDESSESEGERPDAGGPSTRSGKGKGRGKAGRKNHAAEYYDLEDPFIDDSELALDERTYFAQTKQQGFYVSSGEVALMKDKSHKDSQEHDGVGSSPKKPKSRKFIVPTITPLAGSQAVNAAVASTAGLSTGSAPPPSHSSKSPTDPFNSHPLIVPGTRESPITLSDTEEAKASISAMQPTSITTNGTATVNSHATVDNASTLKRKASETSSTGKKKRKTVEIESFHPELQAALYELKDAISRESFEQKGKFPPSLKPILARTALKAIHVGEYNDNFFALMPKLFIYNKYTMTKLIKRTVYADHQKLLLARQDELVEELRQIAMEGFQKAKEEHEKIVQAWERRQEKSKAGATSTEGTPNMNGIPLPPSQADGGADSSMEVDGTPGPGKDKEKDGPSHSSQHMPVQRYRLTERMRNIIWELVVLSNESVRIENEKNALENSTVQVSEQGTRKVLYQKIVAAFPDGWMSSGQISREVSVMKKRYEAQQLEGVS
ncbi:hypothetical protein ACEPAF_9190 [Sanghuangporus sanghuang]